MRKRIEKKKANAHIGWFLKDVAACGWIQSADEEKKKRGIWKMTKNVKKTSDAGSQYRCGRVGRGI